MYGRNLLFFNKGEYAANPQKSKEWNRDAYLVEGAGHCGACHTPKNFLGGDESGRAFHGGELQNWFAPKLVSTDREGIGAWTKDDIVEYLKTGRNKRANAAGLMGEVIENSTSKMTDADLRAMATYLKDNSGSEASEKPSQAMFDAGKAIYEDDCSACHQSDGKGVPQMFPPLAHNTNAQQQNPTSVIHVVLDGARTAPTDEKPTPSSMPAFDWKLTDQQVAAVANYVRNNWGNSAVPVTAKQVSDLRENLKDTVRRIVFSHSKLQGRTPCFNQSRWCR